MTGMDWDRMTPAQADRLIAAVFDPKFESREAFQQMNAVLDSYHAGTASYADYQAAWDEFERIARETGELG